MADVTSTLWKVVQLTQQSTWFPLLVRAAAQSLDVTYTEALLSFVASRPQVTSAVPLTVEAGRTSSVDVVLEQLVATAGPDVDQVILGAVRDYQGLLG